MSRSRRSFIAALTAVFLHAACSSSGGVHSGPDTLVERQGATSPHSPPPDGEYDDIQPDSEEPLPLEQGESGPSPEVMLRESAAAPEGPSILETITAPLRIASRALEQEQQPELPKEAERHFGEPFNREGYNALTDNPFINTLDDPLSTFSIDVDTASYANIRRYVQGGSLPPPSAVRIEEMINYFDYDYPAPKGEEPFSVTLDVANAPWAPSHRLVRIGLKGKDIEPGEAPPSNLVFLVDVSGSMSDSNKLPLLKESLHLLVKSLDHRDSVAIVTYAGSAGVVLPPTPGYKKNEIHQAIERLGAGGSTNGAAGIITAYELARWAFIDNGNNRVLLATDGDFNVGVSSQGELARLIEEKAKTGIFLSVLGFGMGNYQDGMLEEISNKGNGNYAYIDTMAEAKKVLVDQRYGTLFTIAKDVKIQIEFNPLKVSSFRLLGYENRVLAHRDFNDDKKDAGEIGAGHTVTALYEVIPAGVVESDKEPLVDELKYQRERVLSPKADSNELLTVKLRYKRPDEEKSTLLSKIAYDNPYDLDRANPDFRFAAAVAAFGMLLRDSPHKGSANVDTVLALAAEGRGKDKKGYRAEFVDMVKRASRM